MSVAQRLTAGLAGDDVAILAVRRPGPSLVALLHDADMAHGSPRAEAVLLTEDGHIFGDFLSGTLAAGERTHLDVVDLLFSLSFQDASPVGLLLAFRIPDVDLLLACSRGVLCDAMAGAPRLPLGDLQSIRLGIGGY